MEQQGMTTKHSREACLFCEIHERPVSELEWYDRPIVDVPGIGLAVAGLGAPVPGYVLVAPAIHVSSSRFLPHQLAVYFVNFIKEVQQLVESTYGPTTLFEHGSCANSETRRSACIEHCHLHIVPGKYSLEALDLDVRRFRCLEDFIRDASFDRGYLMYQEPSGAVCCSRDLGVSQYFRRQIARTLGRPEEWDYAVFPNWPNVRQTCQWLTTRSSRAEADRGGPRPLSIWSARPVL